jgi:hypothetical protein
VHYERKNKNCYERSKSREVGWGKIWKESQKKNWKAEIKTEKSNRIDTKIRSGNKNEYMEKKKNDRDGRNVQEWNKMPKHVYIHNT